MRLTQPLALKRYSFIPHAIIGLNILPGAKMGHEFWA
jgi:hypothetical protein